METTYIPIVMKCTQQQFDAIKPKLEEAQLQIYRIEPFTEFEYLTNNYGGSRTITNTQVTFSANKSRTVYHTWDENIFLQACGIVVDHYTVPKEFILEAHKEACLTWKKKIENQFPKLFTEPQFEIGKWYSNTYGATWLFQGHGKRTYGFTSDGCYCASIVVEWNDNLQPADPQRVKDLLNRQALHLGIKKGATVVRTPQMVKDAETPKASLEVKLVTDVVSFYQDLNLLSIDGRAVFLKGQWAEVKHTVKYTVAQLEQMLGHKVEIVSEGSD